MNREQRRLLQRQGQLNAEGDPVANRPAPRSVTRRAPEAKRASVVSRFVTYMREVRIELGKVLWPKRKDVVNYSSVVLTTLVLLALLIFGLNLLFAKGVAYLFR
ncbi:MAG TPA: preprotein translocase subunit SecE [Acidimicrobiales bacterium]|nr:preprotein translocase subunit SecE [Acidimicrobiales bacterium]